MFATLLRFETIKTTYMKYFLCLLFSIVSIASFSQENNFETCYLNLCENGELTFKQISSEDEILVKSKEDGSEYEIISYSITFVQSGKELTCTGRGGEISARCVALRDRLAVGDEMIINSVVFKDIKGGGKIRTAPELKIKVKKTVEEEE